MKGLQDLLDKLRGKKRENSNIIPPGYVRCTRCGQIVKKEKATLSLPENLWVCDECYFGRAT